MEWLGSLLLFLAFHACCSFRVLFAHKTFPTNLQAELRILIQGTTNAFTTVRTHDVVSYQLERPVNGHTLRLGVLSSDMKILPLSTLEEGSAEFIVDPQAKPLSAERLKTEKRLGRMYSSDRNGQTYTVDEYISDDIWMPVLRTPTLSPSAASLSASPTASGSSDAAIALLQKELEVARLEYALLKKQTEHLLPSPPPIETIQTDKAPLPIGPYSQAMKLSDSQLFVSGCIGIDPVVGKLVEGGIEAETQQALANLQSILEAGGASASTLLKTTIYVTDLKQYATVNKLYGDWLQQNPTVRMPARSTVQVSALPLGALVEIDAIAAVL